MHDSHSYIRMFRVVDFASHTVSFLLLRLKKYIMSETQIFVKYEVSSVRNTKN